MNFNLSRWALNHQGIILYFMILFAILGVHSYLTLGQSEDPPFTFRVMVINTQWPGASAEEVEAQVTDRIEQLDELLVALGDGVAELGTVHVEVVEQAFEVVFGVGADRRSFNVLEDPCEGLVEVRIVRGTLTDVLEQLGREDVEALLLDRLFASELGLCVAEPVVVEARVACFAFALVDVGGEVLGDEPVEQHAEHVGLEVPAVDGAAEVVRDAPDGLV